MPSPFTAMPWLLPGCIVAFVLAVVLGPAVGRALRASTGAAVFLIATVGAVLAATLTPLVEALEYGARGSGVCDLTRVSLGPISDYLTPSDASLNVLLFVPLGCALGLLPHSRRTLPVCVMAILLPFLIEATQLLVPSLDRGCQAGDIVDNLMGLAIGLGLGALVSGLNHRWHR